MIVPVEVPDEFAKLFRLDEAPRSRELLEAFVLQRYTEGELSGGQVSEALGLSFQETEQFLHDHAAPGLTVDEHLQGLRNIGRSRSK